MIPDFPAPILATSRDPLTARLKVSTATRQEFQIANGAYYVGSSIRQAIPINNTNYSVLKAPADKYLVIEDAISDLDFLSVSDGKYSITIEGFVGGSILNSWTYTPVDPKPIGSPLNTGLTKSPANLPTSTIDLSLNTVTGLTGVADYPLLFADYYKDTSGNRESISNTGSSFFDKGRQIIIAPNDEVLIRTVTAGDATGGANIRLIFFTSEITLDQVPTLLGISI